MKKPRARNGLMPEDHWVMQPGENVPPSPVFYGVPAERAFIIRRCIREAGRYAIRAATGNGTILDFDPDAMLQEFELAMCGPSANLGRAS